MSYLAQPLVQDLKIEGAKPMEAPAIVPAPAPLFQAPVSVPIIPAPAQALAPSYQFRGEGGTPFGARPAPYIGPYILPVYRHGDTGVRIDPTYDPEMYDAPPPGPLVHPPVENPPDAAPRPGEKSVVLLPKEKMLARPPLAQSRESAKMPERVEPSGPIVGKVLGYDLAMVPLWVWLVGAALVGSVVLRR